MKKEVPRLAKKLKALRNELRLTQKEVADRASVTESAYRAYELGDRNPKPEILKRIAAALEVRPEYLSAPVFENRHEFVYAVLDCEDLFGYTARDFNGIATIAPSCDSKTRFFEKFVRDWSEVRKKLDDCEIDEEEYAEWKRTYDSGV